MYTRFTRYTVLCFALIAIITVSPVNAQNDREPDPGYLFYKANALYEEGKYDEALKEYAGLIDQGFESGNLYYNIGNSYFKKGELGRAVLNYERARKLIPGDSDLKSNYQFALSKVRNTVSANSSFYGKIMVLYKSFSINGLTIILSVMFIIVLLFIFIIFIVKPVMRYKTFFAAFLTGFFLLTAYALFDRIDAENREGVLISESSTARFEPVENATVHFTIYEGTKLYIVQVKKEWLKIRRQDGKFGWIKKADLEII